MDHAVPRLLGRVDPVPPAQVDIEARRLVLAQYLRVFGESPAIALIWSVVGGILAARLLFDFWRRTQMGHEAARVFLQENLWQETRSEQDRIARKMSATGAFSWPGLFRAFWALLKVGISIAVIQRLLEIRP